MSQAPKIFFLVAGIAFSCSQITKKGAGSSTGAESAVSSAAIISDSDGVMVARFDPAAPGAVSVTGSSGSPVADASVVFGSGSLSADTEITLQEGASLADSDAAVILGLSEENPIVIAGPTLLVTSSEAVEVNSPFHIFLPVPKVAGLVDNGLENLAVIYRAERSAKDGFIIGLMPLVNLTVEGGKISFGTRLFGAYQAVLTSTLMPDEVKVSSAVPMMSQAEKAVKIASNTLPTVQVLKKNSDDQVQAVIAGDDGSFALPAVSETPSDKLSLVFGDENGDSIDVSVSDCPAWANCKIYDDMTSTPSVSIGGTPTRKDGGDHTIKISAKDFFGDPLTVTIIISVEVPTIYAPVAGLKFVEHPDGQDAVTCAPYTIATVDSAGNVTRPAEKSTVFLTSGAGRFHTDSNCTIGKAVDTVTFGPDVGSIQLYYKNSTPQSLTLAVFAPEAWNWASASYDLAIVPGPVTQLKFSKLQDEAAADACLALEVSAADSAGNPRSGGDAIIVGLTGTNALFFTDEACTVAAVSDRVTILAGEPSQEFFSKNQKVPGGSVIATAIGKSLKAGAISVSITPTAVSQIAFTAAPETLKVNECSMFMVGTLDQFSNPSAVNADVVITMSTTIASGDGGFFADAQCTVPLASDQLTIGANSVEEKAYFRPLNTNGSPATLTATTTLDAVQNKTVSKTGIGILP